MYIYPPLRFGWGNGFMLIVPLLVLRFGIPILMKKAALAELDYFPPRYGGEKLALKIYLVTNTFLIFSPLLAEIRAAPGLVFIGWLIYLSGVVFLALALIDYCQQDGLRTAGLYGYSRNPVYMGYLGIFLGTGLLISSWTHLLLTVIYQVAVHGLILSEERWCLEKFGPSYQSYLNSVPRYIIK